MPQQLPSISVVTVCFNSERYLADAIESVLQQEYPRLEYIVVDGGSTDGTLEVIRSYEQRFGGRLRWISEHDDGIYDAMNKGIALCTGELVGLLNSDDSYLPGSLAVIGDAYSRTHADAVYGDVEVIAEDGTLVRTERARVLAPGETRPDDLPMCHQSLFVKRDAYERIGGFDTRYRILADYEWLLRGLAAGMMLTHVPRPIARFRVGGACNANMSRSNREREQIRVAYGANPVVERLRRWRHGVNLWAYRRIRRLKREEAVRHVA